jgi:hypothetical protein
MQARDLFGVALRVLGVWFLIQAATDAVFLSLRLGGIIDNIGGRVLQDKFFIAFYVFVALLLIVFADHLVGLSYGRREQRAPE